MSKARELAERVTIERLMFDAGVSSGCDDDTQLQAAVDVAMQLLTQKNPHVGRSLTEVMADKYPAALERIADLERRMALILAAAEEAQAGAHVVCCDCCTEAICGDAPCGAPGHPNFVDPRCAVLRGGGR